MPPLNPFLYGKPVPPVRHVGRQDKVRTLFSRLYNGESTAIVGEPHIGKSSMLRYMADEGVRAQWLSEAEAKYLFTEVRLLPFSLAEGHMLIDLTLTGTGVAFTDDDYAYIHVLAGWRPFLMQIAAAGMFESIVEGKSGEARYQAVSKFFHDCAAAHFDDFWRHLLPSEQTAMIILILGEMKGWVDGREFDTSDLGRMEWYGPELVHLQEAGMVEQVEQRVAIAALTLWQGERWRVTSRGFVWWAANNVVAGTRETTGFDQWLRDKEYHGLLSREQADSVRGLVSSIPNSVISGVAQMTKVLLAEAVKGWTGLNLR
jgi:hypothetical protein